MKLQYVIEFRNGTYFQNLEAECGGPAKTAQRFKTAFEAERFMSEYPWILFHGGMVVPAES